MSARRVIVVGAGGAGLSAAVSAAQAGSEVVLLEAEARIGGSLRISSGLFSGAGTSVQRALGIVDDAGAMSRQYLDLNQWKLEPAVIEAFCRATGPTFEWLLSLGVDVPARLSRSAKQPGLGHGGVGDVWRSHVPAGEGEGVVFAFERALVALGVEPVLGVRVDHLLTEDSRIVGVAAGAQEWRGDAVVITTGGVSHDDALLAAHFPRALASPELFRVAAPGSRGDHLAFAREVEAAVAGSGQGLLLLAADFQKHHHWTAGFPPKSRVYLDASGRRFTNEDVSYSVSTGIFDRVGGWAWMVFDESARLSLGGTDYVDWTPENILDQVEVGVVVAESSLEALARRVDLPPRAVITAIEQWNRELPAGREDSRFHRERTLVEKDVPLPLAEIASPPFYAVRIRPSELVCTHVGLEIDPAARVRDRRGGVIPGLFAAGEAGAGVLGESYVGGGNSVANAVTMGRLAGLSASQSPVDALS